VHGQDSERDDEGDDGEVINLFSFPFLREAQMMYMYTSTATAGLLASCRQSCSFPFLLFHCVHVQDLYSELDEEGDVSEVINRFSFPFLK
jgi:hypothetical protein